jgi:hypothetical protein
MLRSRRQADTWVKVVVWGGLVAVILTMAFVWMAISTWVLMTAWNYVMPNAFGWPELTFWQALALIFVLHVIGGSFRASVQVTK